MKKSFIWNQSYVRRSQAKRDFFISILLTKSLKRGFGGHHFDSKILSKYQTQSKTEIRFVISMKFATFECILGSFCDDRHFGTVGTVYCK